MIEYVLALCFFILIVTAMAVGVIFGRGPIKGTCGGLSALMGDESCEICGGDMEKCEEANSEDTVSSQTDKQNKVLAYNAAKK